MRVARLSVYITAFCALFIFKKEFKGIEGTRRKYVVNSWDGSGIWIQDKSFRHFNRVLDIEGDKEGIKEISGKIVRKGGKERCICSPDGLTRYMYLTFGLRSCYAEYVDANYINRTEGVCEPAYYLFCTN